MNLSEIRWPKVNSLLGQLLAIQMLGILTAAVGIYCFYFATTKSMSETHLKNQQSLIETQIAAEKENWVSWQLLDLREALNEGMNKFALEHHLQNLNILKKSQIENSPHKYDFVLLADSNLGANEPLYIAGNFQPDEKSGNSRDVSLVLFSISALFISVSLFSMYYLRKHVHKPIGQLIEQLNLMAEGGDFSSDQIDAHFEIKFFLESIRNLYQKTKLFEREATVGRMSAQVAHDIRSPLAALNVATEIIDGIPEDRKRLIRNSVQRINDIANGLLLKAREGRGHFQSGALDNPFFNKTQVVMLGSLIESIISEKRIQFRNQLGVRIEVMPHRVFEAFAKVDPIELSRILSNLINNSIEAFAEQNGRVLVSFESDQNCHRISIKDNGKGIPSDVLKKLGQPGLSFGKEYSVGGIISGTGLGVSHAKMTVDSWGGSIAILSVLEKGTEFVISLPKTPSPVWFQEQIVVGPQAQIVIVDDDISIHNLWEERLDGFMKSLGLPPILRFTSATEFRALSVNQNMIFLIDYELFDHTINGIDLISERHLQDQATLVTSRFDETVIRDNCVKLGIKLLPKSLIGYVPINVNVRQDQEHWDAVLFDDDILIGSAWKIAAEQAGKKILWFTEYLNFQAALVQLKKSTSIYVDCELGNGIKGEIVARDLIARGFKSVWLATGYSADDIDAPEGLMGVVGKEPPKFS
jgi:signal transduction histidine kinase